MNERPSILIVEDETHLAQGLLYNLRAEGYTVEIAGDGESALEILTSSEIDAVILDVMLPGRDGFSVAAELRSRENYLPILMLTARGRPEDILRGFDAGADDYLAKPFDLSVLLARLNGLLRRVSWHRPPVSAPASMSSGAPARQEGAPNDLGPEFSFAGRTIDFDNLELRTQEKTIRLTLMECDLLRYLVRNRGRIVSRKELLEQVWRVHEDTDTRAIDNFMVRLRRYLEDNPASPVFLETVRGVGYRFLPEGGERP
ncbi:MAG TPA: response regulator transcription factor [Acidobacteriaceae bacterium]|nr:response regulator transcription factor [Acidobacteriaceae bacterium]